MMSSGYDPKITSTSNDSTPIIINLIQDKSIHSSSRCDGCKTFPIKGRKYRCHECKDYDLCETCYLKNKSSHNHVFKVSVQPNTTVHTNVKCDGCGVSGFSGHRFKCNTCNDYDLCTGCYLNNHGIHTHSFTQI